jgi:hypothetical protein
MKIHIASLWIYSLVFAAAAEDAPNRLSTAEAEAGWELLFDGKELSNWRNYKKDPLHKGWFAEDGAMVCQKGGDIVTRKEVENFELSIEWLIPEGGNSGIFILVDEGTKSKRIHAQAPELQLVDNEAQKKKGKGPETFCGVLWGVVPGKVDCKPAGTWNHSRIRVMDRHLQIWINGALNIDIVMGGDDWNRRVAGGPYAKNSDFGWALSGRIGLQDHKSLVMFRNIKIRGLNQ